MLSRYDVTWVATEGTGNKVGYLKAWRKSSSSNCQQRGTGGHGLQGFTDMKLRVVLPLDCPPLGIERGRMPSRRSNSTMRREAAVHERHEDHGQTYPQHNFKGQHCGIGRWPHFRVQGAEVAVCSGFRSATLCKHRHSPGNWSSTLEKHPVVDFVGPLVEV